MGILKPINAVRRRVMHGLTKNVGGANKTPKIQVPIKRILVCRPNHRLGNLLLITPLLQELTCTFPDCRIDLFVRGTVAPVLFKNYDNIDHIFQLPEKPFNHLLDYVSCWISIKMHHYDLVINVDKGSSSGRLSTKFAHAAYKFFGDAGDVVRNKNYKHMAKSPVLHLRKYLETIGLTSSYGDVPTLNLRLSQFERVQGKAALKNMVNNDRKTICLFTYATGEKCYPESWWISFYDRLKAAYPNHNIIEVLPVENVSQIGFRAPAFYSKDIRQIGGLIAAAQAFIGADSGIMHLASAVQTPTIGLFCVTDMVKYAPYNHNSIAINNATADECLQALYPILSEEILERAMPVA